MNETTWTASEKKIARRVFMEAVQRELALIMTEFKARAAGAKTPDVMWELEGWLRKTRRDFDEKYDFRYPQLDVVFARLLREKRIELESLKGLKQERIERIARFAAALEEAVNGAR